MTSPTTTVTLTHEQLYRTAVLVDLALQCLLSTKATALVLPNEVLNKLEQMRKQAEESNTPWDSADEMPQAVAAGGGLTQVSIPRDYKAFEDAYQRTVEMLAGLTTVEAAENADLDNLGTIVNASVKEVQMVLRRAVAQTRAARNPLGQPHAVVQCLAQRLKAQEQIDALLTEVANDDKSNS